MKKIGRRLGARVKERDLREEPVVVEGEVEEGEGEGWEEVGDPREGVVAFD
jgi:hypothetical protein